MVLVVKFVFTDVIHLGLFELVELAVLAQQQPMINRYVLEPKLLKTYGYRILQYIDTYKPSHFYLLKH